MTNQEAIKLLEDVKSRVDCFDVYIFKEEGDAIDIAIKALEFAEFTGKMLFDDWENDCNGVFPELACRRLCELGIVELNDGVYSLKKGEK